MSKLKEAKEKAKNQKPESESNIFTYALVGFFVLLLAAGLYLFINPAPPAADYDMQRLLEGAAHVKGPADAKVTIVEFSDFQCPVCKTAHETVNRVLSEYSGKIRFVYRHFPLGSIHPFASSAAEASECAAEQGKFWEMYDKLFLEQPSWTSIGAEKFKEFARELNLDVAQFDSCVGSRKYSLKVQEDFALGVSVNMQGTPTFFINGVKYQGVLSLSQFKKIIDAELTK
ncbi:MAG: thioredoxin domain-containing protein [Candidatus Diapherotrites archaeon]